MIVGSVVLLVVAIAVFSVAGCASPGATFEERSEAVRSQVGAMQDLGVKGRLVFIWGTSHAGGQAFNITGSSGFCEITLDPLDE